MGIINILKVKFPDIASEGRIVSYFTEGSNIDQMDHVVDGIFQTDPLNFGFVPDIAES